MNTKVNLKNIETVDVSVLKDFVKSSSTSKLINLYSGLNKVSSQSTQLCQKRIQQVLYRVKPSNRFLK
jgi:hypothetical protein